MDEQKDQQGSSTGVAVDLDRLREEIALVQVLDLQDHSDAYEQIHSKLEEALRSIDGK